MKAHVAPWKKEAVDTLATRVAKSRVVGVIDVKGVPAPAFQTMRSSLRGKAEIVMLKNTLMNLALQKAAQERKGLDQLAGAVDGQCAVVTSDLNPFKLYKQLDSTKTKMPAKGGEIAPDDIEIKAGETPFKPGPVVGELQKAGLPAAIEQGKVVIKKDKVLVKKGEKIPREVALVLSKLEIYPLTVGLSLSAAFEDGTLYQKDVLAVDETLIMSQVTQAASGALNLAVFAAYPTKASVRLILSKAYRGALGVALDAEFPTKDSVKLLVAKANAQMLSLASRVPDGLDEDLKKHLGGAGKPPEDQGGEGPEPEKKEEKKEEKVSEEEAASGLSALFG